MCNKPYMTPEEITLAVADYVLDVLREHDGVMSDDELAEAVGASLARELVADGDIKRAVDLLFRQGLIWRASDEQLAAASTKVQLLSTLERI